MGEGTLINADPVDSIPAEDTQYRKGMDKQWDKLAICPTMEV